MLQHFVESTAVGNGSVVGRNTSRCIGIFADDADAPAVSTTTCAPSCHPVLGGALETSDFSTRMDRMAEDGLADLWNTLLWSTRSVDALESATNGSRADWNPYRPARGGARLMQEILYSEIFECRQWNMTDSLFIAGSAIPLDAGRLPEEPLRRKDGGGPAAKVSAIDTPPMASTSPRQQTAFIPSVRERGGLSLCGIAIPIHGEEEALRQSSEVVEQIFATHGTVPDEYFAYDVPSSSGVNLRDIGWCAQGKCASTPKNMLPLPEDVMAGVECAIFDKIWTVVVVPAYTEALCNDRSTQTSSTEGASATTDDIERVHLNDRGVDTKAVHTTAVLRFPSSTNQMLPNELHREVAFSGSGASCQASPESIFPGTRTASRKGAPPLHRRPTTGPTRKQHHASPQHQQHDRSLDQKRPVPRKPTKPRLKLAKVTTELLGHDNSTDIEELIMAPEGDGSPPTTSMTASNQCLPTAWDTPPRPAKAHAHRTPSEHARKTTDEGRVFLRQPSKLQAQGQLDARSQRTIHSSAKPNPRDPRPSLSRSPARTRAPGDRIRNARMPSCRLAQEVSKEVSRGRPCSTNPTLSEGATLKRAPVNSRCRSRQLSKPHFQRSGCPQTGPVTNLSASPRPTRSVSRARRSDTTVGTAQVFLYDNLLNTGGPLSVVDPCWASSSYLQRLCGLPDEVVIVVLSSMPPKAILCSSCKERRAVLKRPRNGHLLCRECFFFLFEEEVHETITKEQLFSAGEVVACGASGGKDSTVLIHLLKTLNDRHNYGLQLQLVSVDEGIVGYRDDSLETVRRNSDFYGLPLHILSFQELFGWSMDQIVKLVGLRNNCTYCGVFRRQALDFGAAHIKADKVVTGHNADDLAETILMNLLRADAPRLTRCTSAITTGEGLVPRVKPLKYAYEKEIVLYAHFKELDYFTTECTYAKEAFRGTVRGLIKDLEALRPRSIADIIRSGEQLIVYSVHASPANAPSRCARCGYVTSQRLCRACVLVQSLNTGCTNEALYSTIPD